MLLLLETAGGLTESRPLVEAILLGCSKVDDGISIMN